MHWRDEYEVHADRARAAVDALPVETLLDDVRRGHYGEYYGVWYSIADRASLEIAGWILFDILHRDIDYLYRYHCAAALLSLLEVREIQPVELSGAGHDRAGNLGKIDRLLTARLGARPTAPGLR